MGERINTALTRPQGQTDNNNRVIPDSFQDEAFQGDYLGGQNLIYKGFARPGAPITAQVWQIAFLTYDSNNNITMIQWPVNQIGIVSNDYEFVWSLRTTYTYA